MLGRLGLGQYHFRLAGGFVVDLHGRELRREDFMRIWRLQDCSTLQLALEATRRRPEPLVVEAAAQDDSREKSDATVGLEIALCPLAGPSGAVDRIMGLYQPLSPVAALRGKPTGRLSLKAIRSTRADLELALPELRLATVNGRRVA